MSRRAYQALAIASLPLVGLGAYALGGPLAERLAGLGGQELRTILRVLGYALAALGCVLVWGIALLPLRRRAGFTPLRLELRQIESEGLGAALARERSALESHRTSPDPAVRASWHLTFAAVGGLLGAGAAVIAWALLEDGVLWIYPLCAAVVCPALCVYHLVVGIRLRRQAG